MSAIILCLKVNGYIFHLYTFNIYTLSKIKSAELHVLLRRLLQ